MKTTISYANSPAKAFDAVQDIKDYFGPKRWEIISPMMAGIRDPDAFAIAASFGGVEGYPVEAWYDLYHGQGAFRSAPRVQVPLEDAE